MDEVVDGDDLVVEHKSKPRLEDSFDIDMFQELYV